MKIISPRCSLKLMSLRTRCSSKLRDTSRNSIAGVLWFSVAIAVHSSSSSSVTHNLNRAMRPRRHRSGGTAEQESFEPITEAGGTQEDTVGAPLFGEVDQDTPGIAIQHFAVGAQARRLQLCNRIPDQLF